MRVIALIEDPSVIQHILEHLGLWAPEASGPGPPVPAPEWPANAVIPLTYHPVPDIAWRPARGRRLARRRPLAPGGGRCADLKPAAWDNGRCESADPARTMLPTRPKAPRQTALRTRIRTKHAE